VTGAGGSAGGAGQTGRAGHECWSFDDQRQFDAFARKCVQAGLEAGEQVWYVPGRFSEVGAESLPSGGAVRVISFEEAYAGNRAVDPAGQVAAYTAATEQALAAGFTGFRVVADVTSLVRTDEQRDAFARYEYMVGRYMLNSAMTAVCAYDRRELGDRAVAELACLHESSHAVGVTFQLHSGATTAEAVLDGEVEDDLFAEALGRTDLAAADGEVVVDATGLRFVDHRALIALDRHAEARGMIAVVRTPLGVAARLAGLLELTHVRVEATR
jgi:hypothetical protein